MFGTLALLTLMGLGLAMAAAAGDSVDVGDDTAPDTDTDEPGREDTDASEETDGDVDGEGGDGGDDEPDTDDRQPDEEEPDEETEPDTGASFLLNDDGSVSIDVGDDENRSLVVFIYNDTEEADNFADFVTTYEARFYLLPEGVELPQNDSRSEGDNIPGTRTGSTYEIGDLETALELELLGTVDLGTENAFIPASADLRDELPPITANRTYDVYYVEAQTDEDDIENFLSEGAFGNFNGARLLETQTSQVGTEASDWLALLPDAEQGAVLDGRGGDDLLSSDAANSTLLAGVGNDLLVSHNDANTVDGGAGDDEIWSFAENATLLGGDGADEIWGYEGAMILGGADDDSLGLFGTGSVFGEDGNDTISALSTGGNYSINGINSISLHGSYVEAWGTVEEGPVVASGGDGEDELRLTGSGAVGFGDAGDDVVRASSGATGYGGDGNDSLVVSGDSVVFGDAGDDTISNDANSRIVAEDIPTATGGTGADTYDLRVGSRVQAENYQLLRITDFDMSEDVLQIGGNSSDTNVLSVTVNEAADGSHTDVDVLYRPNPTAPTVIATIRLDGVTGLTEDQIVLT